MQQVVTMFLACKRILTTVLSLNIGFNPRPGSQNRHVYRYVHARSTSVAPRMIMGAANVSRPYRLIPLPNSRFGREVYGIDLKGHVSDDVIEMIKEDVTKWHRLLVFRDQGIVPGDRHVEISQWFGPLESTFYKHPASPHPDVFRVSNDPRQGCTGVGRTGWHVDGSFQQAPFSHSIYHIVSVPKSGDTVFAPLHELLAQLSPEQRARWERLWMCSDRRGGSIKPLIYTHPISKLDTMCFHLGMTAAFIWDYDSSCIEEGRKNAVRQTDPSETEALLTEIETVFNSEAVNKLVYSHKWQQGDFIISDNAALGHEASPETQTPPSMVGLRVMHRTTVQGQGTPVKEYRVDKHGYRIQ